MGKGLYSMYALDLIPVEHKVWQCASSTTNFRISRPYLSVIVRQLLIATLLAADTIFVLRQG